MLLYRFSEIYSTDVLFSLTFESSALLINKDDIFSFVIFVILEMTWSPILKFLGNLPYVFTLILI